MPFGNRFPPSFGVPSNSDFGRGPPQVNDPTFVGYNQFRPQPNSGVQGMLGGMGNGFQMPSWLQGLISNAGFGGIFGQNQQPSQQQQQQGFGQHIPIFSGFGAGMGSAGGGMGGASPQQGLRGLQGGAGSPDMRQISATGQFVNWSGRPGPGPPGLMGLGNPAAGRGMAGGNPYQVSATGTYTTARGPNGTPAGGAMTRPVVPGGGAGQATPFGSGSAAGVQQMAPNNGVAASGPLGNSGLQQIGTRQASMQNGQPYTGASGTWNPGPDNPANLYSTFGINGNNNFGLAYPTVGRPTNPLAGPEWPTLQDGQMATMNNNQFQIYGRPPATGGNPSQPYSARNPFGYRI